MPFSSADIDWITEISGKKIDAAAQQKELAKAAARDDFLTDKLGANWKKVEDEVNTALKGLTITNVDELEKVDNVWKEIGKKTKIPIRATESDLKKADLGKYAMKMDLEVDTNADIGATTLNIPPETVEKITKAYERILGMQKSMESQLDADGGRLFSDEDIRRELWTPMMRKGLIPENLIPDRFSEQAIAQKGARDLYAEKLTQFSKTTSKAKEATKRVFRVSKEVVTLSAALASGITKSVQAMDSASIAAATKDLKAEQANLKLEQKGLDATLDKDRLDAIKARLAEIDTGITDYAKQAAELTTIETHVANAGALLGGGLGFAELIADVAMDKNRTEVDKMASTAEKAVGLLSTLVSKSVDSGLRGAGASAGMATHASTAVVAGFAGAKIVPNLVMVIREPDTDKRIALIQKILTCAGDCVASGLKSYASKLSAQALDASNAAKDFKKKGDLTSEKSSTELAHSLTLQADSFSQIAGACRIGITQAANAPAVLRALQNGNHKEAAMLLGGAAVAVAFGAASESVFDTMRSDVSDKELYETDKGKDLLKRSEIVKPDPASFTKDGVLDQAGYDKAVGAYQTSLEKRDSANNAGAAAIMESVAKAMESTTAQAMKGLKAAPNQPLPAASAEELAKEITEANAKAIEEQARKELDEAFSPDAIAKLVEDADAELAALNELYSDAFPDTSGKPRKPEEVVRAEKAIDKAMKNTAELRQKVAIINGLTATGAGILAALVPGASAVACAQKIVMDLYKLVKAVETHNTWVASMKLAFAAESGTAAAIENTLDSAEIQLDHVKVSLALHTLQAGAAVAQVFDPTGASTIVSSTLTMAEAVVEFGYKMHTEYVIDQGWKTYKEARDNPKNRKAGREALRKNPTLAKCCIAYGATIMNDASAKEAVRATGLTVAALQNDKDICVKLIAYLTAELADDPQILKVVEVEDAKWHPGRPVLTIDSWLAFKSAARAKARPQLSADSLNTPAIDRLFGELTKVKGGKNQAALAAKLTNIKAAIGEANAASLSLLVAASALDGMVFPGEPEMKTYQTAASVALSAWKDLSKAAADIPAVKALADREAANLAKGVDAVDPTQQSLTQLGQDLDQAWTAHMAQVRQQLEAPRQLLRNLAAAFGSYQPLTADMAVKHEGMAKVTDAFRSLARMAELTLDDNLAALPA